MRDLLSEVKDVGDENLIERSEDIEMGSNQDEASMLDESLKKFLAMVEDIKGDMERIKELHQSLEALHEQSKTVTRSAEMKGLRERMQQEINSVSKQAHAIKTKIEALDKDNAQNIGKKGCEVGSSSERMRSSITATLKKNLKDLMVYFSELRKKVTDEYREVVERRLYTVTGEHASEERINEIIDSGQAENIFQEALLKTGRGKAMDTLAEIRERQQAVKDLESSLLELHQIFLDMAVLVESQGELLDNIENQVSKAVNHVNKAVTRLESARRLQRSSRKMMCCILFCLLIIGVIIVVIFLMVIN